MVPGQGFSVKLLIAPVTWVASVSSAAGHASPSRMRQMLALIAFSWK
jgi:hypothetical protein